MILWGLFLAAPMAVTSVTTAVIKKFLSTPQILCLICSLFTLSESIHYYVQPTEPLNSCPANSSCPPGQQCQTIDYLVEHSHEFFSPDHINVTLTLMCGVHNSTKSLTVQNLHSFVTTGGTEFKENQIISFGAHSNKQNYTTISFFNVNIVNITTLIMQCPSINLEGGQILLRNSNLYGYTDMEKVLSTIHITGKNSSALLSNCIITENCFVVSNMSAGITVNNSTFHSYRHNFGSIILALSSVVTLTGYVNFTDSILGINFYPKNSASAAHAIYLKTTDPERKSLLDITMGATVFFVNLSCSSHGGAVFVDSGVINVGAKANVVFMHIKASVQGVHGGAVHIYNGQLNINTNASVHLCHNCASRGGAVYLYVGTKVIVNENANVLFYNNSAIRGGAVYSAFAIMQIYTGTGLQFISNTADHGGAVFIHSITNICSAIIVNNFAALVFANNSAFQGGALYITPSSFTIEVGLESKLKFVNNTVIDVGGAVYSELQTASPCLFLVTDYSAVISFIGNNAKRSVGHHIYGSSMRSAKCDRVQVIFTNRRGKPYCWHWDKNNISQHINLVFQPDLNQTLSPVSSVPWRVCLCDSNDRPQCASFSQIFTSVSVYHGEIFTLSAYVVGYDFGTTVGSVYAELDHQNSSSHLEQSQYNIQLVNSSKVCTSLKYTVYTIRTTTATIIVLPPSIYSTRKYGNHNNMIRSCISDYFSNGQFGCIYQELLTTPVFVNVTLLPGCPPGLTLRDDNTKCSCYSVLTDDVFQCFVRNKGGYIVWNNTVWINATFNGSQSNGIIYNSFCPLHYCKSGTKTINTGEDPSKQCASNRTGIMCGACMKNFSMAIGSSRCIECFNSHNVALLLAFAAASVFLVFFVLTVNLTVTQGLINGFIFYTNIVWDYKPVIFPLQVQKNNLVPFFQVFLAWFNLDFGIETCFFVGLDAYWKTWLQFVFPFYIWAIAGVIIVACRFSSRLTNFIGSRAVHLLATLFLLSYMKLLRIIIDATLVAVILQYPQNTSYLVWYLNGNLRYCHHPHIYLFITAIATLLFLWLPYTLLLLFIQPLRRVSHLRPLKWINKLAPVYSACLSTLKDKHQYWFGTMLLVRGILLVILKITSTTNPKLSVFTLSVVMTTLVIFICY